MFKSIVSICSCTLIILGNTNPRTTVSHANKDSCYHIYLTFDDGPEMGTKQVDSIVRRKQVKVNVFVIGEKTKHADDTSIYYKLYRTNPFIEIYNPLWSHANFHYKKFYEDSAAVLLDVEKCQAELDLKYKIVRLPGRNQWRLNGIKRDDIESGSSSADGLYKNGYAVIGWDLEWKYDAQTGMPVQTVEELLASIRSMLKKNQTVTSQHLVLLMHDNMFALPQSITAVSNFIDSLKSQRKYCVEHLSSYPGAISN